MSLSLADEKEVTDLQDQNQRIVIEEKVRERHQTSFARLKKGHRRYLPSPSHSGMFGHL